MKIYKLAKVPQNEVKEIRADFLNRKASIMEKAQLNRMGIGARIKEIKLGGSYGQGTRRDDSDIDLEIHYSGKAFEEEVWYALMGKLWTGTWGIYDIVPVKVKSILEE